MPDPFVGVVLKGRATGPSGSARGAAARLPHPPPPPPPPAPSPPPAPPAPPPDFLNPVGPPNSLRGGIGDTPLPPAPPAPPPFQPFVLRIPSFSFNTGDGLARSLYDTTVTITSPEFNSGVHDGTGAGVPGSPYSSFTFRLDAERHTFTLLTVTLAGSGQVLNCVGSCTVSVARKHKRRLCRAVFQVGKTQTPASWRSTDTHSALPRRQHQPSGVVPVAASRLAQPNHLHTPFMPRLPRQRSHVGCLHHPCMMVHHESSRPH